MENEETKQTEEKKEEINVSTETPKLSVVEEAAKIRDELVKVRDEIREQNDRKEKLTAEEMLGGTTGGSVEKQAPEETPQEYAKRVIKGGL